MRCRAFALTLSCDKLSQEDFIKIIPFIDSELASLRGYTVGHIEVGSENEYLHYHALLYFDNPINLDSVISYLPNIHVECVNSYKRYRDYMKKDGPFYSDTLSNSTLDNDIIDDLIKCNDFKDFIILHPNCISQIKNYRLAFELLRRGDVD